MVFKYMKNETLDELITRFYHLMTELDSNNITYSDTEKSKKLLNALPPKWDLYSVMLKENASYSSWTLDEVIGKLRAYDLNMQQKETSSDVAQNPSLYHGKKISSTANPTGGVTAFFSGETETADMSYETENLYAYVASSGAAGKGNNSADGTNAHEH